MVSGTPEAKTKGGIKTHELVGLLDDNNALAVVAQPHRSVGTRRAAADDGDVPGDAPVTMALERGARNSGGKAAEAHTGTHDVMHVDPRNATRC